MHANADAMMLRTTALPVFSACEAILMGGVSSIGD